MNFDLYKDIAERTSGDVYLGIVGPVRSGKSAFIKQFMESVVIPNITDEYERSRTLDELPQSGSGKSIMTTQIAFIPNEAVEISFPGGNCARIRLIDSVGYMIDGALGGLDGNEERMVYTPWEEKEISFEKAAEIGTKKVIQDHSTIGIVITTDGTVTDLPRTAYIPAEKRAIEELKLLGKPFVVILNTNQPFSQSTTLLKETMSADYGVPVIPMNVMEMGEREICDLLKQILDEFPVEELVIQTPEWLGALEQSHWLVESLMEDICAKVPDVLRSGDVQELTEELGDNPNLDEVAVKFVKLGSGKAFTQCCLKEGLFNRVLAEQCGTEIKSDAHLLSLLRELVSIKKEYDHVEQALKSVRETGYGIVPPLLEELTLQEPEIIQRGGQFGVKLRANAPSLHMMRVDIQTEVSPAVGTEQQSEEMIRYLMDGFEQNPQNLWQSNLFGKPLSELVREGLANKLVRMPADTQIKIQQTIGKIINEGTGGMICILL